ncbi:hypothetical protein [Actinomadura sp. 3N508]|uniref:hypothetical protein n=1 Tax=Actinomadura sp. 3N508 TaxID=3375153 RepID=UPI00379C8024
MQAYRASFGGNVRKLAILPIIGPSKPRATHLTRDFINRTTIKVAAYLDDQSGSRATFEFLVFDWFRLTGMTDEQWATVGHSFGLFDLARPLITQGLGVDLTPFTHFALVIDDPDARSAAWAPGKPYLHLSAIDMTPALFAHELGHMFGANHSRLDQPLGLNEYGDPFCIMGAEGGKWSFDDPSFSFRKEFGEPDWRFCVQCFALYFDGNPTQKGTCPGAAIAGTGHATESSAFNHVLRHGIPSGPEESGWRLCGKCFMLFFGSDAGQSRCPAGGGHDAGTGGRNYALPRDIPPGPEQSEWRKCQNCRSLFYSRDAERSRCPAGPAGSPTPHVTAASSFNYALPHDINDHNASGPGMIASTLLGCGWLNLGQHGVDLGPALRSRPGEIHVQLRRLRGAPPGDTPQPPNVAFADGLANERVLIEYRARDAEWDRAIPDSAPGEPGWVLVHLTSGSPPHVTSTLIARLSAKLSSTTFIPEAFLSLRVVDRDDAAGSITLRVRSETWPVFGAMTEKTTLAEASDVSPSVVSNGERIFLAWKGSNNLNLNLLVSGDNGVTYGGKHTSRETSEFSPTLAALFHTVFIAWTGEDSRLNIAEVEFSNPQPPQIIGLKRKVTLAEKSPFRPSLTSDLNGALYLAWTGEDNKLNIIISLDRGATWSGKFTFRETSDGGPAIFSHAGGRLFLAWKGSDNANLNVARVHQQLASEPPQTKIIAGLGKKATLPETSDYAPDLASQDDLLLMGWTGEGDEELNLAGPMGDTSGFGKRVYASESSEAGLALTTHNRKLLLSWRGSGNEHLNVASVARLNRVVDDFTTGPFDFDIGSVASARKFQQGSMLGAMRMVRVSNLSPAQTARVKLAIDQLNLVLGPKHIANLAVGYGLREDPLAPGLGINLHEGGADRIRVMISHVAGIGVYLYAHIFTPHRTHYSSAFVGAGPTEFRFADFAGQGAMAGVDFTNVTHILITFQVVGSWPGATVNSPSMTLDAIEIRGPAGA